ncbi:MAG: phosphoadenylyl-sulfate reductase [Acidobacteriota bacterium]|nr:phosphoadenylyl-sulfate reductase [Acidobacteriota bacterium]
MSIEQAFEAFRDRIHDYRDRELRLFSSSSFQSHSIPLLHQLARIDPTIPVYFLDTGYHFPETLVYRRQVAIQLGLNVIDIRSPVSKSDQLDPGGRLFFASDPDHCCYLNKTLPMDGILREKDVWISGLRRDQNAHRNTLALEEKGPHGTVRFHPMLEWSSKMVWKYIERHDLPRHPLEDKGYPSVGCRPCTRTLTTLNQEDAREGRWVGLNKTECGLHTELIERKSIK